jgi:drug/metabolite transporter (DMT)-like permease
VTALSRPPSIDKTRPAPHPGISQSMSAGQWGILLTLSVLWGGSFYFNAIALQELPPITLVLMRTAVASVILFTVLTIVGERMPINRAAIIAMFTMGFLNNTAPFILLAWGQSHIGTGPASILNATTPLWTVIFAHFFTTDEKLTANRLAGVAFGIIGVAVLVGPSALAKLGTNFMGQLACIGAASFYAAAAVFGRRFRPLGLSPLSSATGQATAASLLLLPLSLLIDHPWNLPMPTMPTWLAILGLASLSTALGYLLFFRLLSTAGATNIQLVTFLVPVTAILLGVFLLGEHFDPKDLGGMALIGCGLSLIDGRIPRRIMQHLRRA